MRSLLLAILLSATVFIVNAQPCSTIPGMNPQTAIAVCGTTLFQQDNVNDCQGLPISGTGACGSPNDSHNAYWYKIHCYQAGTLGFLITPLNWGDDFDWELFDVTGIANLNQVYTNESLMRSLNLFGDNINGITGCSPLGIDSINCGGPTNLLNRLATIHTGHDYLLMVNKWNQSGKGYILQFTGGTAVITDPNIPVINSVATVGCNTSLLKVTFSKDIICPSVTSNGSEFSITPGNPTISSAVSQCTAGGFNITELNLQLQNPLPAGNYNLVVNPGSDVNTFKDVCGNDMVTGFSIPFTVVVQPPVTINPITYAGCAPTVLNVPFTKPVWCTSVTGLGTEFSILPGNPAINMVQSTCTFGYTNLLQIVLQNPLAPGNYQLVVNDGTDSNTFIDTCNGTIPAGSSFPFTIAATTVPPVIQSIGFDQCHPDKVVVNFDKPVSCATISATGNELSLNPPWPVNSITYNCTAGIYTSQITMNLQNPLPPGNYNVVVNNGSDGTTLSDTCFVFIPLGYSQPFVATPPPPPPVIQTIGFDACHPDKLVLNFDKPVNCASLIPTATGSEFSISPGVWPISAITSGCGPLTYTSQVTLTLQNPLPGGNFAVNINNGSDGTTLSDTCLSFIPAGYNRSFTATQSPPPVFVSAQIANCDPSSVRVFYNFPIKCNSVSPDGSDFFITGPSAVNIVAATTNTTCALGYTSWIDLQFASPINVQGNYVIHNGIGTDGNGIIDTCFGIQVTAETISFNALAKPSAVFNSQVNWGCVMDTVVLSHPGGNGANSWTWNFSDGSTASGQTVSPVFPVSTATVGVQLIVSNGSCSDTAITTITLGNAFQAAFTNTPADTFCINTPVNFTNTSSGTIVNYLWDFGDLTQFNGQTPPTHTYPLTNTYNVQLIATDNHGCMDTASKLLQVNTTAFIDFTGLKPQYCTGNPVVLTRQIARTISSYVWDNGDGKTFTNEVEVNFSYANEGVYTITLTGEDLYCGPSSVSKTVPVYAVPIVKLGADTVLCQSERILIGVLPTNNYTYLWSTGANTPQIYTDIFTRDYSLTADNNGCRGYDAMHVKVLPACLIKVPGAFTPNGDGLNDVLKALNADLAKNFSFKVFNRLGQLIFSTNNPLEGWDGFFKGNAAETGTYVWMLSYTDPWTGNDVKEKGTSILLR